MLRVLKKAGGETHGQEEMGLVKEAPVFCPSAEEFSDPMGYIEKIRPQAEAAGICKIVPPEGWKSPFAVDTETFRFHTRVQNVCKVDGVARVEREFVLDVRKFLFQQEAPMGIEPPPAIQVPGTAQPQPIRLYRLHVAVQELGGGAAVAIHDRWATVASKLFPDAREDKAFLSVTANTLRDVYERYLMAYELHFFANKMKNEQLRQKRETGMEPPSWDTPMEELLELAVQGIASGSINYVVGKAAYTTATSSTERGRKQAALAQHPRFTVVDGKESKNAEESVVVGESLEKKQRAMAPNGRKRRKGRPPAKAENNSSKVAMPRICTRIGVPPAPKVEIGSSFYKYYHDVDACYLGRVVSIDQGADRYVVEYSHRNERTHSETVSREDLTMLLASGETKALARDALLEGICQECMRADNAETLLLCDGCNFAYHSTCLSPPMKDVPPGDWFCSVCLSPDEDEEEDPDDVDNETDAGAEPTLSPNSANNNDSVTSEKQPENSLPTVYLPDHLLKTLASFGYGDGDMYSIEDYRVMANKFKEKYFDKARRGNNPNILEVMEKRGTEAADLALEREYWRLVSDAARVDPELVDLKVSYGSDLDTGVLGSGFPTDKDVNALRLELATLKGKIEAAGIATNSGGTKRKYAGANSGVSQNDVRRFEELRTKLKEYRKYAQDGWNLNIFPKLNGSLLQHVDEDITGVIVPWLYMGMMFSSFSWHTEDHYFASINYHHFGEPKTWYGVPSSGAPAFETAARQLTPELFKARKDILTGIVTQYNPMELAKLNVPVFHIIQRPGDIVLTFPQAYHGGFNHGLNCAEAVNFATRRWISFGEDCVVRYAELRKNPVISHDALLASLAEYASNPENEAAGLARNIFERVQAMEQLELRSRKKCLDMIPNLVQVTYEEAIKENPDGQDGKESKHGGMRSRMGTSYGRERSHMSRLGRMAPTGRKPGETGWLVQVQCHECKRFCSLSFIHVIWPPKDGKKESTQQFFCLEHAQKRLHKRHLSNLLEPSTVLELVTVWSKERLTNLVTDLGKAVLGLVGWRYDVWTSLCGEISPIKVQPPTMAILDKVDSVGPESGPVDGCPPGVLFTLKEYVASGAKTIRYNVISDLVSKANDFNVNPTDPELLVLKALLKHLDEKFESIQLLINQRRNASSKWPTLEECQAASRIVSRPAIVLDADPTDETLAALAQLEVEGHPVVVQLQDIVSCAKTWMAQANLLLSDPTRAASHPDEYLMDLEVAKKQLDSKVRIKANPTFEKLQDMIALLHWRKAAVKLLEKPQGGSLGEATRLMKVYTRNNRPTLAFQPLYEQISHHVDISKEWVKQVEMCIDGSNPDRLVDLMSQTDRLRFTPLTLMSKLQGQTGEVVHWSVRAGEMISKLRSLSIELQSVQAKRQPEDAKVPERVSEYELLSVCQEGERLGFSAESCEQLAILKAYLDQLHAIRTSLENVMIDVETLINPRSGSLLRQVERNELLTNILRAATQCMKTFEPTQNSMVYVLPEPGPTIASPPEHDNFGCKLHCACRRPGTKGDTLFPCTACGEKYHPTCLDVSAADLAKLTDFVCPTCVADGALEKKLRVPGQLCYCGVSLSPNMPLSQCDTCSDLFHPLCVGRSAREMQKLASFTCPSCCRQSNKSSPPVRLFCLCRKPEFGTSDCPMLCCERCQDWFHPVCIRMSNQSLDRITREQAKFVCPRCCDACDVPYSQASGKSGFVVAKEMYLESYQRSMASVNFMLKGTREVASLRRAATVAELGHATLDLEYLPILVPEQIFLRSIYSSCKAWEETISQSDIRGSSTRAIWSMLLTESTFPVQVEPHLLSRLQAELWMRHLVHCWVAPPDDVEVHPNPALRTGIQVGNEIPPHIPRATLATFEAALSIPSFLESIREELRIDSPRRAIAALLLRHARLI